MMDNKKESQAHHICKKFTGVIGSEMTCNVCGKGLTQWDLERFKKEAKKGYQPPRLY